MPENFDRSVMVALLPITTDWCKITLPHLTLVYAGQIEDHRPFDHNELLKDAANVAFKHRTIQLRNMGVEIFGKDVEKVEVFRLQATAELMEMRRAVESWNASEFPFNPHVTIGPIGSFDGRLPTALAFDRVLVAWGDQQTTFWMKP